MNKSTILLSSTLCAGILIAGIGTGVAFGEYSSLDVETLQTDQATENATATRTVDLPKKTELNINASYPGSVHLEIDEAVEPGTIKLDASMENAPVGTTIEISDPIIHESTDYTTLSDGTVRESVVPYAYAYISPEMPASYSFEEEAEHARTVLDGLKSGVLYVSDDSSRSLDVVVTVNPADEKRIIIQ